VYDTRLDSGAYLKVDYTVERGDGKHQQMVWYAFTMGVVYCAGIPGSWVCMMWSRRDVIRELQRIERNILRCSACETKTLEKLKAQKAKFIEKDPYLDSLSPLYRDYEEEYWWWEIPRFFSMLVLCGLVTVTQMSSGSQIFVSLMVSTAMLVAFANCNPYLLDGDDRLAQFCQVSLSLALSVGLLEKAEDGSFQSFSFGAVLIACVTFNWILGLGGMVLDLHATFWPERSERLQRLLMVRKRRIRRMTTLLSSRIRPVSGSMNQIDSGKHITIVPSTQLVSKDVDENNPPGGCTNAGGDIDDGSDLEVRETSNVKRVPLIGNSLRIVSRK